MPVIPLFNDGQSVQPARLQPPNLARTHQVLVQLDGAARNYASPSIPWQLANNRGGQAMGAAFGQIAGLLEQRAIKQAEAINIRKAAEADAAMDAAHADFETWKLSNPDETKWAGEWQNRLESLRSSVVTEDLSPKAAEDIGLRFDLVSKKSLSNVATSAAKTSFQKAGETLTAQALRAYEAGDTEGGDAYLEEGVKRNYIGGVQAARMQIAAKNEAEHKARQDFNFQYEAALNDTSVPAVQRVENARSLLEGFSGFSENEKKAKLATFGARVEAAKQEDDAMMMADIDPQQFLKEKDSGRFDKLDPSTLWRAEKHAKATWASEGVKVYNESLDKLRLGQWKPDETFENEGFSPLTPLLRDMLKAENAAYHNEALKALRVKLQNSPAIYENAVGVIAKYDPAADEGGLRKAEIGAALETNFSGPYLDELRKRLDARGTVKPGEIDDAPALSLLKEWTDGGGLGDFKVPVMQDGKPAMKKREGAYTFDPSAGLDLWGLLGKGDYIKGEDTFEPVTQVDPVKQAQAAAKLATIRKTIEAETKAGKFKSSDEVVNRAVELYQQHGGKAPASTAETGALLLLPSLEQAKQAKALEILNFKPAK